MTKFVIPEAEASYCTIIQVKNQKEQRLFYFQGSGMTCLSQCHCLSLKTYFPLKHCFLSFIMRYLHWFKLLIGIYLFICVCECDFGFLVLNVFYIFFICFYYTAIHPFFDNCSINTDIIITLVLKIFLLVLKAIL